MSCLILPFSLFLPIEAIRVPAYIRRFLLKVTFPAGEGAFASEHWVDNALEGGLQRLDLGRVLAADVVPEKQCVQLTFNCKVVLARNCCPRLCPGSCHLRVPFCFPSVFRGSIQNPTRALPLVAAAASPRQVEQMFVPAYAGCRQL